MSRDSSACIATGCGLNGRSFSGMGKDFSPLHSDQTGSGEYPPAYTMGTGVIFFRGLSCRGVKLTNNGGDVPPLPDTSSWRGA
jgi:hypothetical protein